MTFVNNTTANFLNFTAAAEGGAGSAKTPLKSGGKLRVVFDVEDGEISYSQS